MFLFWLKLIMLIWRMSIITAFRDIKRYVVYPFCFLPFLDLFLNKIGHHIFRRIELVSIWWPSLVVFRPARQWCWCFRPPILRFLVIFFFTPPTDPKPGNIFDAKRTKRGWPQLSLMVSFCFVFFLSVCEINWNWHCLKTLYIPFGDSQVRIKKSGKGEDLLTATALGWG